MLQLPVLTMLKIQFAPAIVRLPLLVAGLCASGLSLNLLSGLPARALTVTNSANFQVTGVLVADGEDLSTGLFIGGLGASVANVWLSVTLTKCGGTRSDISPSGVCNSPDFSENDEIQLFLKSPTGTLAQMVFLDDLSGQAPGATATWNFQDSFSPATLNGATSLQSGNYQSTEPFSLFNGEDPNGTWTLIYEDTTPGDPLSINSWSIAVTDETGPGPGPTPADVPGPLPLFGVAAAFGWSRLLRKRIRARRDLRSGS